MTKLKGYAPYYNEYLDNMETYNLTDSEHTVTIELASGSIAVDAVAVLGAAYEGEENRCPEEDGEQEDQGSSLTKVTIGKNVTSIGKEAFAKDKALKKLVIKSSGLKKVGKNAIKGISGKTKISCGKKNVTAYKKLFTAKTGYIKSMKITK